MKTVGYALITLGFLAGAWGSVQAVVGLNWPLYLLALSAGVVGVVLAQLGGRLEVRASDKLSMNIRSLEQSLERICRNITELDSQKEQLNPYDAHGRIDELFPDDLTTFVDARESIGHVHGLPAYADVMNEFAAGERYLNRVWSASVDGYIHEVNEYLGRAREQFTEARDKLHALQSQKS